MTTNDGHEIVLDMEVVIATTSGRKDGRVRAFTTDASEDQRVLVVCKSQGCWVKPECVFKERP